MRSMDVNLTAIGVAYLLAGVGAIILPVMAFLVVRRWLPLKWRVFALGAATFLVFQGILRLPWQRAFTQWGQVTMGATVTMLLASLTAGLFEETGRYVAYRIAIRRPTKADAVALGLGHGGLESAILVGLGFLSLSLNLFVSQQVGGALPPEAREALEQARETVVRGGLLAPIVALVERIAAMAIQVGLSVLVGIAYIRQRAACWWAAVGVHFAVNAISGLLAQFTGNPILTEIGVVLMAGILLASTVRLMPIFGESSFDVRAPGPAGSV